MFKRATGLKRKLKMLNTFLLSYIIVLLIPIAIGSIAYFKVSQLIEQESNNSRMTMLNHISYITDANIKNIERVSLEILLNYNVQNFLSVNTVLTTADRYNVTRVMRDLQSYRNNDIVKDFYIYYKNSDLIISSIGMYPPEFFYNNLYSYKSMEFEEWRSTITSKVYNNYYIPAMEMSSNGSPQRMITYLQSIPFSQPKAPSAVLIMYMNEELIKDMLSDIATGGLAYIMDKDNHVIVKSGIDDGISPYIHKYLINDSGLLHKRINGQDMVISYIKSQRTGWKYVSVIPGSIFMAKANYIKNLTIWIVGICLVIGLLVAFLLARKNYSPIRHIADTISGWLSDSKPDSNDELNFIEESVVKAFKKNEQLEQTHKQILKQNEELQERIDKNWPMVRNSLLSKLIRGNSNDFESIREWLKFYDIEFNHNQFSVILFHIPDNYLGNVTGEDEQKRETIKAAVSLAAEELANKQNKGYICTLEDNTIALIINFLSQSQLNGGKDEMYNLASIIKDYIIKEYGIAITAGIGRIHEELKGIQTSYKEATMAMDYKIVKGNSSIIYYEDILNIDKDYYYPIDIELQLINYVRVGNIVQCNTLLDYIFEENFYKRKLALKLNQCLFFDIMSTAIKTMDEIKINYSDIFGDALDPVNRLTGCETINEIHFEIKDIYKSICEYINSHKISHNSKLRNMVLEYINTHYMDECLSQTIVAEQLNVTSSYLSRFFKQEFGLNMVDYINQSRVEKAKQLLDNRELSVQQIAKMVGCGSDRALARIFKQYESTTPGKFRDFILPKEDNVILKNPESKAL